LLEREGKIGHVTFIDGAPNLIKTLATEHYKVHTDEAIQESVIGHIFSSVFSNLDDDFIKDVLSQTSWLDRCNKIVELASVQGIYGKDFMKLMLNALVNRIKIILNTDIKVSSINNSKGTLLRPTLASVTTIAENYDLHVNFKENIDVKYFDGNHFSILENPKLWETLNQIHLSLAN
jgi:hypothetical protein